LFRLNRIERRRHELGLRLSGLGSRVGCTRHLGCLCGRHLPLLDGAGNLLAPVHLSEPGFQVGHELADARCVAPEIVAAVSRRGPHIHFRLAGVPRDAHHKVVGKAEDQGLVFGLDPPGSGRFRRLLFPHTPARCFHHLADGGVDIADRLLHRQRLNIRIGLGLHRGVGALILRRVGLRLPDTRNAVVSRGRNRVCADIMDGGEFQEAGQGRERKRQNGSRGEQGKESAASTRMTLAPDNGQRDEGDKDCQHRKGGSGRENPDGIEGWEIGRKKPVREQGRAECQK
jgi:hypothetical protein